MYCKLSSALRSLNLYQLVFIILTPQDYGSVHPGDGVTDRHH